MEICLGFVPEADCLTRECLPTEDPIVDGCRVPDGYIRTYFHRNWDTSCLPIWDNDTLATNFSFVQEFHGRHLWGSKVVMKCLHGYGIDPAHAGEVSYQSVCMFRGCPLWSAHRKGVQLAQGKEPIKSGSNFPTPHYQRYHVTQAGSYSQTYVPFLSQLYSRQLSVSLFREAVTHRSHYQSVLSISLTFVTNSTPSHSDFISE